MSLFHWLRKKLLFLTRANLFIAIGFMLLLAGWQVLSFYTHEILLASPAQAACALWGIIGTSYFNENFLITLWRLFFGIVSGGLIGFVLGTAAGLNEDIKNILEPFRWIMLSIPPVVVVVLAMLWFGMGSKMVAFITSVLVAPIVYVNTVKGIEMVDEKLVEMARLYKFGFVMRIKDVYTPAIIGPLGAAMVLITCMGARVVILAELMGANDGIGYALGVTRSNLDVPQLFAWVLVTLGIVSVFEFILLRPVEKHFIRWKL